MKKLIIIIFTLVLLFSCRNNKKSPPYITYCINMHFIDGREKIEKIYAPKDVIFTVASVRGSYDLWWELKDKEWFVTNNCHVKAAVIDFEIVDCK